MPSRRSGKHCPSHPTRPRDSGKRRPRPLIPSRDFGKCRPSPLMPSRRSGKCFPSPPMPSRGSGKRRPRHPTRPRGSGKCRPRSPTRPRSSECTNFVHKKLIFSLTTRKKGYDVSKGFTLRLEPVEAKVSKRKKSPHPKLRERGQKILRREN